jgi:NAD(P)-dependent dehydrogenase (short-subunit alcohol dehydrogenase family)
MDRVSGMRIVVTGASSGVGLALVERLALEGAALALVARGEQALEEAADRARALGAVAHVIPADVSDRLAATAAIERAVAALGGLDAVVCNAGAVAFGHFLETAPEDFDRTIAVTFGGAVNVTRAALPALRASRGTVVAVSSIMARVPLPAFSSYTAAKHALRGFLNTLQVEEREQRTGVRIAMVSPGPLDTPIYARVTSATGRRPATLPDAYRPDEVAKAVIQALTTARHEHIVGGESRLVTSLYATARPAAERLLIFIDRWFRSGSEPARTPGALWSENAHARVGDGHPARRSGDLPALGRNLLRAARRTIRRAPTLVRPIPEAYGRRTLNADLYKARRRAADVPSSAELENVQARHRACTPWTWLTVWVTRRSTSIEATASASRRLTPSSRSSRSSIALSARARAAAATSPVGAAPGPSRRQAF